MMNSTMERSKGAASPSTFPASDLESYVTRRQCQQQRQREISNMPKHSRNFFLQFQSRWPSATTTIMFSIVTGDVISRQTNARRGFFQFQATAMATKDEKQCGITLRRRNGEGSAGEEKNRQLAKKPINNCKRAVNLC